MRKVKKRNKIEHDGFVYDPRIIRVVLSDSIVLLLHRSIDNNFL